MIAEAIDTVCTLGWALLGWLIFFATVAAMLTLAATATGAWAVRGVWRLWVGRGAPETASRDSRDAEDAPRPSSGHTRPVPSWAHSQPLDHQDAA